MTSWFPWPILDWKISGDGLLTFFGGLLAFLAILYQVRQADAGIREQIETEKKERETDAQDRCRAVATALLFELDNFYIAYIRGHANEISSSLDALRGLHSNGRQLRPFRKTPSDPFPVYKANASSVGILPANLVTWVVRAYSAAQWVVDRRSDYQIAREQSIAAGNAGPAFEFAEGSLREMVDVHRGAELAIGQAVRELCVFAEIPFDPKAVTIAEVTNGEPSLAEVSANRP